MRRTRFAYLLILLLSSAFLDDAVAAATPEPSDGELASENNEYLRSLPPDQQKPPHRSDFPQHGAAGAGVASLSTGPVRGTPTGTPPVALSAPSLLYVLMSLQR